MFVSKFKTSSSRTSSPAATVYFHLTTVYGILRHNGVDLGKKEFISFVQFKDSFQGCCRARAARAIKIAQLLVPGQIWYRWKLVSGGGTDVLAYDGLVSRGERWAWFPTPWRVLAADSETN